jgi:septal ring factor EnvC (AmiA/AmiB activator)
MAEEKEPIAGGVNARGEPDPSFLTTAALLREISTLKEQLLAELRGEVKVLDAKIQSLEQATNVFHDDLVRVPTAVDKAVGDLRGLMETRFDCSEKESDLARDVIQTRFEGMDRALKLLQDIADKFPDRIDEKIDSLKEIHDGQFEAIRVQFHERDVRSDKQAESSKLAVDAALQAAKEAVAEQARSAALATLKSETSQVKAIEQQGELIQTTTGALRDQIDDLKGRVTRIEAIAIGQAGQKVEQQSNSGLTIAVISVGVTILLALFAVFAFIQRIPGR